MISGSEKHRFICTDSGCGKLYWFDEEGNITKEFHVDAACYDVWALPDGNILYPHFGKGSDGVSIVTPDGALVFRYETKGEVFGCQPLPNGNILTGELIPKRLCEVFVSIMRTFSTVNALDTMMLSTVVFLKTSPS